MSDLGEKRGLFARLKKTRASLTGALSGLFEKDGIRFDDQVFDELEDQLIMADLGVSASATVVDSIRQRARKKSFRTLEELKQALADEIGSLLEVSQKEIMPGTHTARPFVLMMVGVNGVGKTTTTAKVAAHFQSAGASVMLAACDTFRAAAIEQLQLWGGRLGVPVIAQSHGADAAAVAHDALVAAKARGIDVLIIDSAGRQHINTDLMSQLEKIKRVLGKTDPDAPHEIWLVVDGGTGQNAISQARSFNKAVGLTGVCVTKLDGTARGGMVLALANELGLAIPFIGVGESLQDLESFDAMAFAGALVNDSS